MPTDPDLKALRELEADVLATHNAYAAEHSRHGWSPQANRLQTAYYNAVNARNKAAAHALPALLARIERQEAVVEAAWRLSERLHRGRPTVDLTVAATLRALDETLAALDHPDAGSERRDPEAER